MIVGTSAVTVRDLSVTLTRISAVVVETALICTAFTITRWKGFERYLDKDCWRVSVVMSGSELGSN